MHIWLDTDLMFIKYNIFHLIEKDMHRYQEEIQVQYIFLSIYSRTSWFFLPKALLCWLPTHVTHYMCMMKLHTRSCWKETQNVSPFNQADQTQFYLFGQLCTYLLTWLMCALSITICLFCITKINHIMISYLSIYSLYISILFCYL